MHNVYLGVGRDITGSSLHLLISLNYFGDGDMEQQLKLAHSAMKEYFRVRHIKCGSKIELGPRISKQRGC